MKTVSLRLPDELLAKVTALARRRNVSKTAVIRDALESFVDGNTADEGASAFDLSSDLIGSLDCPRDLSRNKRHMQEYGR